ncbi:hypothetical protein OGAPHI_005706 [Ogataea philodendri]|uniref:Metal resistance protein YCF1 n=1 Tax=Ogataea philodendri TaxID=1378263 RepID=A0A9P8NZR2_9ASCO|nr:uncharacterized protein OGAPHI_005706 [Ogataea philodendri]KAH3662454.1 hypothetical protein OGAPHI_005706 [Ogataea philodendri]
MVQRFQVTKIFYYMVEPGVELCFRTPLISPTSNALRGCFVGSVWLIFSATFAVLISQQLFFGGVLPSKWIDKWSIYQRSKLNLVLLYCALYVFVFFPAEGISSESLIYVLHSITLVLVTLLHAVETSRFLVQPGSLMFFWPIQTILLVAMSIQQDFSEHKLVQFTVPLNILSVLSFGICVAEYWKFPVSPNLITYCLDNDIETAQNNIISEITFYWMNDLIMTGYRKQSLDYSDLPPAPVITTTVYAAPKLSVQWKKELTSRRPSLLMALIKAFGYPVFVSLIYDMANSFASFVQPQLLKQLIKFFGREDDPPTIIGFAIAVGMFSVSLFTALLYNQYFIKTVEASMGTKAGLMNLIYEKSMNLSPESRMTRSTGDIINLMAVDVNRLQDLTSYVQTLFSAPVRLVLCLISLHALLGNATWAGIATMVIMMPINAYLVRSLRKFHREQMTLKDARTSLVAELFQNVKSIKLYAWEQPMLKRLSEARNDKELANLNKIGILSAVVNFAWTCVPFFVSCSTFAIFAYTSKTPLTPEIVFPALSLFDLLSDPIFAIPALMTALIESGVSLKRLTDFLLADEIDDSLFERLPKRLNPGETAVRVDNCTFLWSKLDFKYQDNYDEERSLDQSKVALKNVNFTAGKGSLTCVVGRVGSGKSTFLQCVLGELFSVPTDPTLPKKIQVHGSIAYCSQVPWILNASVKDNILFGHRFEPDFYEKTIEACQLLPDLEILPDGDETIVGEKGISLSGGQKARLALARAVYMRADVYLLDDVLSAVDVHVGQKLIKNVLGRNGILHSKTKILATNNIKVLDQAEKVCLISNNEISESGSLDQVVAAKSKLFELVNEYGQSSDEQDSTPLVGSSSTSLAEIEQDIEQGGFEYAGVEPADLVKVQSRKSVGAASLLPLDHRQSVTKINRKTAQKEETKEKGHVSISVYSSYARACSYVGIFTVCGLILLTVGLSVSGDYWLKHWGEQNGKNGQNTNVGMYVGVYALFGIGSGLFTLIRAMTMWSWCSIRASKKLHNDMASAVLASPMSFFETTPLGRVINRFSQDMAKIDSALPRVFAAVFNSVIKTTFTLVIIGTTMPPFLLIIASLSVVYLYYRKYYIIISRDLKRIVSVTKSPIFAHIQESLAGADTIRAYDQEAKFLHQHCANIDENQLSAYCLKSVNRWLAARLQFIGSVVIFSASGLALMSLHSSHPMSAGLLGLVMSYALRVTSSLSFIIKRSVEIESDVVCCERVFEYCRLEPEEKLKDPLPPPADWPRAGAIEYKNYATRYRANLDPILRNINLSIQPSEKIGIVGRTGSGKSSLMLSLFRIIEPIEGHIEVDGINTSTLSLHDVRSNLAIIPQDAQCINGTVRYNLDPLGEHTDEEIWKCLELAGLSDHVTRMGKDQEKENGLDSLVSESGMNLSVGQRQLMCLGRVLLRSQKLPNGGGHRVKILVLDEATSSVDAETDRIIQQTIRTEFKDLTILTIAHRLDTIMDNDRVLVLENGEIREFASPRALMEQPESHFYKLCVDGGYIKKE